MNLQLNVPCAVHNVHIMESESLLHFVGHYLFIGFLYNWLPFTLIAWHAMQFILTFYTWYLLKSYKIVQNNILKIYLWAMLIEHPLYILYNLPTSCTKAKYVLYRIYICFVYQSVSKRKENYFKVIIGRNL